MQWKKFVIVAVIGSAIIFTLVGCGKGNLATVGGEKITKDEFYKRLENMPVGGQPAGIVVLNQMVEEHLWLQLAKKENVSPTDAQVNDRLEEAKKQPNFKAVLTQSGMTLDEYKQGLKVQQAQYNVVTKGQTVSDADVKKFYDINKAKVYTTPERVKIGAIICKTKKAIDNASSKLKGGTDFSAVVINLSEDQSKNRKIPGELGWVWRGQPKVPTNLIDIAFSLKKGATSDPFQVMDQGKPADWVILRCLEHEQTKVRAFDEVKDQIRKGLLFLKGQQSPDVANKFKQIREEAKIKVNSDKYHMLEPQKEADKGKK
jgi:foldase protein PrsA